MRNCEKVFDQMVEKTYNYLKQNKLETMVLGISGGIDSTVVAFVCAEIAARYNDAKYLFFSLPSSTNQSEEKRIAELIINTLECNNYDNYDISIENSFNTIIKDIDNSDIIDNIALGNIKARLRMMILYHYAYKFRGVVMDTDNLTEHYTGFFTIHGDVGDLSPMGGSLWKTDVYEIANWLLEQCSNDDFNLSLLMGASKEELKTYVDILKSSINIAPTDGNCGGTDMDQIAPGYTYNKVDAVLKKYIKYRESLEKFDIKSIDIKNGNYVITYKSGTVDLISEKMMNILKTIKVDDFFYFDYKKIAAEYFDNNVGIVENLINRVNRTEFKRKKQPVRIELDVD